MLKKYIIALLLIIGHSNTLFSAFPLWWAIEKIINKTIEELTLDSGVRTFTSGLQLAFMLYPGLKENFADRPTQINALNGKMQYFNTSLQYMINLNQLYPSTTEFSKYSPTEKCVWYRLATLDGKNIFHY